MISAAERKRLQSLKEKKQAFREREQIIQKALANVVSGFIHYNYTFI